METIVRFLIYVHAASGALALLGGLIAPLVKKGNKKHKISGIGFYYSMIVSGLSGMLIAVLPKHESPFLFSVGIFSLYFVLAGHRALRFKNKFPTIVDKTISWTMLIAGLGMIVLPIILQAQINIVSAVFGLVGLGFAIRDLIIFKKPEQLPQKWLKLHLGKMIGGYISASTAFVVVNEFIPGVYAWFVPGVLGAFLLPFG